MTQFLHILGTLMERMSAVLEREVNIPRTENFGSGRKPPVKRLGDDAHDADGLDPQSRARLIALKRQVVPEQISQQGRTVIIYERRRVM